MYFGHYNIFHSFYSNIFSTRRADARVFSKSPEKLLRICSNH
uniref:Uncharacterized protein n=1 Tax=Moniliophthora roreri TaxID=221103 RepID=A0A0W0FZ21_MONRR